MKINLLYILNEYPSKTEHFISNEIEELSKLNFKITIFAFKKSNIGLLNNQTVIYGPSFYIKIVHLFSFLIKNPTQFISLAFNNIDKNQRLFKYLNLISLAIELNIVYKKSKTRWLHSHFANKPTSLAYYTHKLFKHKYSFTAHANDLFLENKQFLFDKIKSASFVISCTEQNLDYSSKLNNNINLDKLNVIYHGINLNEWGYIENKKINSEKINIITIGRLVTKKGTIYLINAIKELKDKFRNIQLTIIGDGELEQELKNYIFKNNLSDYIKMIGYINHNNIKGYLIDSDIFVLPSIIDSMNDRDGLANVLIEAMALGIPTISTDVTEYANLITNYENGIRVESKNATILTKEIEHLIYNNSLYQKIRENARKLVEEKLNIDSATLKISQLFQDAVNEN